MASFANDVRVLQTGLRDEQPLVVAMAASSQAPAFESRCCWQKVASGGALRHHLSIFSLLIGTLFV
jgi:hypothetical protein